MKDAMAGILKDLKHFILNIRYITFEDITIHTGPLSLYHKMFQHSCEIHIHCWTTKLWSYLIWVEVIIRYSKIVQIKFYNIPVGYIIFVNFVQS